MTPEQQEQVRAALAAAGPDERAPMPPEVVARLQGVLDELVEPRLTAPAQARQARAQAGDPAAATGALGRRRRRRRPDVLVAAAALLVIAGAGAAVVTHGFGIDAAPVSGSAGSSGSVESAPDAAGGAVPAPSAHALAGDGDGSTVPRLRTASLRADLLRLAAGGRLRGPADTGGPVGCARPALRSGERLAAIRLDGRRATLVMGPVTGGARAARVYSCGDGSTPVARASVPAP